MNAATEGLASALIELRNMVAKEHAQREKIRQSKKYTKLAVEIAGLSAELEKLMDGIPDSVEAYAECEKKLRAEMLTLGTDRVGNVVAHYRQRKAVNGGRLFTVLGNDIGLFMEIATVTQKNLNEFAKGNPDIKKELTGCIEDAVREIDSLTILES